MITEHQFKGGENSVYMDFNYTFENGVFTISEGVYIQTGVEKFRLESPHPITIEQGKFYNIILTETGIDFFHQASDDITFIDLIAWGSTAGMEAKVMV